MSQSIGTLFLELELNTEKYTAGMQAAKAQAEKLERDLKRTLNIGGRNSFDIAPKVDLSGLHELNQVYDSKIKHRKQVQADLDRNPITPRVNTSALDDLEKRLDRLSGKQIHIAAEVRSQVSPFRGAAKGGSRSSKKTEVVIPKTTEGLLEAILTELRKPNNTSTMDKLMTGFFTSIGAGFGSAVSERARTTLRANFDLDKKTLDGLERNLKKAGQVLFENPEVKAAAEDLSKIVEIRLERASAKVSKALVEASNAPSAKEGVAAFGKGVSTTPAEAKREAVETSKELISATKQIARSLGNAFEESLNEALAKTKKRVETGTPLQIPIKFPDIQSELVEAYTQGPVTEQARAIGDAGRTTLPPSPKATEVKLTKPPKSLNLAAPPMAPMDMGRIKKLTKEIEEGARKAKALAAISPAKASAHADISTSLIPKLLKDLDILLAQIDPATNRMGQGQELASLKGRITRASQSLNQLNIGGTKGVDSPQDAIEQVGLVFSAQIKSARALRGTDQSTGMAKAITEAIEAGRKAIDDALTSYGDDVPAAAKKAAGIARARLTKADKGASSLLSEMDDAGSASGKGYSEGLRKSIANATNATSQFSKAVVDQLKDDLEINSPSRVLERLGIASGDGYLKGLKQKMAEVSDVFGDNAAKFFEVERTGNALATGQAMLTSKKGQGFIGDALVAGAGVGAGFVHGDIGSTITEAIATVVARQLSNVIAATIDASKAGEISASALKDIDEFRAGIKAVAERLGMAEDEFGKLLAGDLAGMAGGRAAAMAASGVASSLPFPLNALPGVAGGMSSAIGVGKIRDSMMSVGQNVGAGLSDIDLSKVEDIGEKIGRVLAEATEDELGIASPSKRFIEIMRRVGEGIQIGAAQIDSSGIGEKVAESGEAMGQSLNNVGKISVDPFTSKLDGLRDVLGATLQGFIAFRAITFAVPLLAEFAKASEQTALQMDRVRRGLTFIADDAQKAGRIASQISSEANRLGIDATASQEAYVGLGAAARGTELEDDVMAIAKASNEASAVYGMTIAEQEQVNRALSQMISKGRISTEELRGQMESLPGSFQIAARAMNVTTAELDKMLQLGQVTSEEFLPKFAQQISLELAGAIAEASNSSAASLARLGNAMGTLRDKFGTISLAVKKVGIDALLPVLQFAANNAELLTVGFTSLSVVMISKLIPPTIAVLQSFGLLPSTFALTASSALKMTKVMAMATVKIAAIAAALKLAQIAFSAFGENAGELGDIVESNTNRLDRFAESLNRVADSGQKTADSLGKVKLTGPISMLTEGIGGFLTNEASRSGARGLADRTDIIGQASNFIKNRFAQKQQNDALEAADALQSNTSDVLARAAEFTSGPRNDELQRFGELDKELQVLRQRLRVTEALDTDNLTKQTQLEEQINRKLEERERLVGEVGTTRQIIDEQLKTQEDGIAAQESAYEQGTNTFETYKANIAKLIPQIAKLKGQQEDFNQALDQSVIDIERIADAIADVAASLDAAAINSARAGSMGRSNLARAQIAGASEGQVASLSRGLEQQALVSELSATAQAIARLNAELSSADLADSLNALGGRESLSGLRAPELGRMQDRIGDTDPASTKTLGLLINLDEYETQALDIQARIDESAATAAMDLRALGESITDYYQGISESFDSTMLEVEQTLAQAEFNQLQADLTRSVNNITDEFLGTYTDTITDTIQSIFDGVMEGLQLESTIAGITQGLNGTIQQGMGLMGQVPTGGVGGGGFSSPLAGQSVQSLIDYAPSTAIGQDFHATRDGGRRIHRGIDIDSRAGGGLGAQVLASLGGTASVIDIGEQSGDIANSVGVWIESQLGNGIPIEIRYNHLNLDHVRRDLGVGIGGAAQVGAGQALGTVVNHHLDYKVLVNGEHVDPQEFMAAMASGGGVASTVDGRQINIPGQSTPVAAPTASAPMPDLSGLTVKGQAASHEQINNARIIAETARSLGANNEEIAGAIATAIQESNLINLTSGDKDSLGLFQQRPSQGWGSREQIADPRFATESFIGGRGSNIGLLETQRGQDIFARSHQVQRSARPDAPRQWEQEGQALATALTGGGVFTTPAVNTSGITQGQDLAALGANQQIDALQQQADASAELRLAQSQASTRKLEQQRLDDQRREADSQLQRERDIEDKQAAQLPDTAENRAASEFRDLERQFDDMTRDVQRQIEDRQLSYDSAGQYIDIFKSSADRLESMGGDPAEIADLRAKISILEGARADLLPGIENRKQYLVDLEAWQEEEMKRLKLEKELAIEAERIAKARTEADITGGLTQSQIELARQDGRQFEAISMNADIQVTQLDLEKAEVLLELREQLADGLLTDEEYELRLKLVTETFDNRQELLDRDTDRENRGQQLRDDRAVLDSNMGVANAALSLADQRGFGNSRQMNELRENMAIADENMRFAEQLEGIRNNADLSADAIERMTENAGLMHELNLEGINAQFSEMTEILQMAQGHATDAFASFLDGSKTAGEAFDSFVDGMISGLAQMASQMLMQEIFGGLFGGLGGAAGGGGGGGGIFGIVKGLFGAADGGYVPNFMSGGSIADAYRRESMAPGKPRLAMVNTTEAILTQRHQAHINEMLAPLGSSLDQVFAGNYASGGYMGQKAAAGVAPSGTRESPAISISNQFASTGDSQRDGEFAKKLERRQAALVRQIIQEEQRPRGLLSR
ncbi:tape measure domain protein [Leptolyngbya sp. PCC 7375]|nr:tape measure domain protein [Leptolyngbya sp. PCC 7375]